MAGLKNGYLITETTNGNSLPTPDFGQAMLFIDSDNVIYVKNSSFTRIISGGSSTDFSSIISQITALSGNSISQATQIAVLSGNNISVASQIAELSANSGSSLTLVQVSNASANAQIQTTNNLSPLIFAISGTNISQAVQIASLSASISNITGFGQSSSGIQGRVPCVSGQTEYTISHATINTSANFPVVSLEVSDQNDTIFVQGIYDRQPTSFKVVLGGSPNTSNAILYHIGSQGGSSTTTLQTTGSLINITPIGGGYNLELKGVLVSANNLSDVTDPKIARNNIDQGIVTLTESEIITTNCASGNIFILSITDSITSYDRMLANPINMKGGATYQWIIKQAVSGTKNLSCDTKFKFRGGSVPVLTATPTATDILSGLYDGTFIYTSLTTDYR